ncbi:hypothetical protein [Mycobacteroides abscessus]|uniref:Uncharacterized protein n=1 Tax=Mycobacteroides abscessus subsp. massiliense TaxID=1962118 RepID=A0A1U0TDE0_9MYCO|nr:hypothetical protein [Mycobacteroides abscessus]SKL84675.1 Uncharacterised protein [Mycobacteroides abscessus subsp. massiliense]SKS91034.1 Uncharacterised protein [Mycobacteroides abscessus subsp. massiliense]SKT20699.1 Uncharacterised protein [Mycobacteroides abscessus subsp. massiliense]SKW83318.1 Uncharacterised protein [Mycobacteroides abscessus subsp. massiliense]
MAKNETRDFAKDTIAALKTRRALLVSVGADTEEVDEKLAEWADAKGDKEPTPELEKKTEPTAPEKTIPAPPVTATAPKTEKAAPAKAAAPAKPGNPGGGTGDTGA